MAQFFKVQLRTTDVDAARAFYRVVFGWELPDAMPLHEQARARGARPHWLGFLHVEDVERAASAFAARGATPLGPKWVNAEGLDATVMRDPGGAVIALAKPPANFAASAPTPAWYALNTNDVERAKTNYGELFGWEFRAPRMIEGHGMFHPFAYEAGGPIVGSLGDVAGRAGVHPHWLFHFKAPAFTETLHAARQAGALVLPTLELPDGHAVAACDDPQGAAFAVSR